MYINWAKNELNLKVVYYGPAMSGKTTNLLHLHAQVDPGHRSELVSLKTSEDRTIYFDFLQVNLGKISGLFPRLQFYTVPGQAHYEISRRLVLRGADGVVFVADSQEQRLWDNLRSWKEMNGYLAQHGLAQAGIPILLQWNKCDLRNSASSAAFRRAIAYDAGSPYFRSIAIRGVGILDTLQAILKAVIHRVQREVIHAA